MTIINSESWAAKADKAVDAAYIQSGFLVFVVAGLLLAVIVG